MKIIDRFYKIIEYKNKQLLLNAITDKAIEANKKQKSIVNRKLNNIVNNTINSDKEQNIISKQNVIVDNVVNIDKA